MTTCARLILHRFTVQPSALTKIADLMDRVLTDTQARPPTRPTTSRRPDDDAWRISIAVAGFSDADLSVEVKDHALVVTAKQKTKIRSSAPILHRGIATRAFERRFHLADHVRVTGASHADGMLHIDLVREVPEALKPRRIEIAMGRRLRRNCRRKGNRRLKPDDATDHASTPDLGRAGISCPFWVSP
jgi:molecular chaperone IbpA